MRITRIQSISLAGPKSVTGATRAEILRRSRSKNVGSRSRRQEDARGQTTGGSQNSSRCVYHVCSCFHPESIFHSFDEPSSCLPASSAQTSSAFTQSQICAPPVAHPLHQRFHFEAGGSHAVFVSLDHRRPRTYWLNGTEIETLTI